MLFTASTIKGSGRGKDLEAPTINLLMDDVPPDLAKGIYACTARLNADAEELSAVLHYGPRPVFNDSPSCEVHILDRDIPTLPEHVTVTVLQVIRKVKNFSSPEELKERIAEDIRSARAILEHHAAEAQEHDRHP